ncbi:MAG: hypothetical protein EA353_08620 [Puniceicoccaceae bacterium]|nr:MAG: hypothetical protein EA353_08620 [Puniceicoccaceae bacterium]
MFRPKLKSSKISNIVLTIRPTQAYFFPFNPVAVLGFDLSTTAPRRLRSAGFLLPGAKKVNLGIQTHSVTIKMVAQSKTTRVG